jgi:glutamate 5-kinase
VTPFVVKVGSSVVADDRGELRLELLEALCDEVARRHEAGDEVVVVTSGAIARGMRLMELPMRPSAMQELQAASAVGQGKLYRHYDELLQARGVKSAQVLLTFFDISARTHYLNARHTLRTLLDWRVVPVINENDTTTTDEISFGDNDFLAAQVAILLGAERLVLLTDTGGLYTSDPRGGDSAELVEEVRELEELDGYEIGLSSSPIGSGGMRSKVVAAEMATAAGIPVTIASGVDREEMARALAGEAAGTRFLPRRGRVSSFKLWLRYGKPARGRLSVDAGAERALRERGTSLLPVGVVEVEGEFEAGDAVEVRCQDRLVGKGIVGYSAAELRRIKGLKTEQVKELLPRATEEAVHRDYFVLD